MLLAVSLFAVLATTDSLPRTSLDTARVDQGAAVVVHRQPSVPVVALRMALLADDPPEYAGAGHLVQHLVYPRLRSQVAQVGGRVQMERSSDAIIYTVTGPAQELGMLAGALRFALRPPEPTEGALLQASRALAEERLEEWETARKHVRASLRARLFPRDLPAAGTEGTAQRLMEPDGLREAWARIYRPDRVAITAVGDVRIEDVRAAFGELPEPLGPSGRADGPDTVTVEPLAPPEATRAWFGLGYLATDHDPAAVTVATRLMRDELQALLPASAVEAEHWWTHHGQAIALVVAAPADSLARAQRLVGTAVAAARSGLAPSKVEGATRAARREMLFYARTPDRMAEVIGRFSDRDGDPDGAQRFYAALERVDQARVRRVLDDLATQTPVRVEVPPQKLIVR